MEKGELCIICNNKFGHQHYCAGTVPIKSPVMGKRKPTKPPELKG